MSTLMDAVPYDEKKEQRKKNFWIGALVFVVLVTVLALAGYFSGHGWFFSNVPAEMRVSKFLTTVEAGDFNKAYAIWMNDDDWQQHPQKYEYTLQRFTEDWSTKSDYGIIHSHKVKMTHRDGHTIIVGVEINGSPDLMFLNEQTTDGALGYSPVKLAY